MGVVSASGYLGIVGATQEHLHLGLVILAATAGAVLGALPLYYLGRSWGEERVKAFADRHGARPLSSAVWSRACDPSSPYRPASHA